MLKIVGIPITKTIIDTSKATKWNDIYLRKLLQELTYSPIFRQNHPYAHVSTQRWHTPRGLQIGPLTSHVKYFSSTMTMAPSIAVQSWKMGYFQVPLDTFPGYWESRLDKISVGWFVLYPQELNPAHYEVHGLCQSPKRKPLKIMKSSHNSLKL